MSTALFRPVRSGAVGAFAAVGGVAFTVHFCVVAASVPFGVPPLVANVVAFAVAFAVSFVGHARWSFPARGRPIAVALRRFGIVAVAGFAINETAYALLLGSTTLDYRFALIAVLSAAAGMTWIGGRYWAFAHA